MKRKIQKFIIRIFTVIWIISSLFCFGCTELHEGNLLFKIEYIAAEGGFIQGEMIQNVEVGNDGSVVTAIANDGYVFVGWSDGEEEPSRQEKNIQNNINVTAYFEELESFFVMYIADEGGKIIGGQTTQLVKLGGKTESVTAEALNGYYFVGWSDGVKSATRYDEDIRQELRITAYFVKDYWKVQYSAGEGGIIEGNSEQLIEHNESATKVTAVPHIGYKFLRWSDTRSTNPVRQDINVSTNINATALFEYVLEDGRGTERNPILIDSHEELMNMKLYPDLYYKLNCDLYLEETHQPIFGESNGFNGILDGEGHTIYNMNVDIYSPYPSLLGYIESGTVKNLNLIDFNIIVPDYDTSNGILCVGSVAGESWGIIDNVNVQGTIIGKGLTHDGIAIGGLVGQAGNTIMNCSSNVNIEIENITRANSMSYPFNVGGLVGVGVGNINSCKVNGTIKATNVHGDAFVGGLIGYLIDTIAVNNKYLTLDRLVVINCETDFEIVNGNTSYAKCGGLIGSCNVFGRLNIENCSVYGDIINSGNLGGFISYLNNYSESKTIIKNCFVENDIYNANGAGFIYFIKNDGTCELTYCYSKGQLNGNMVAGFCYVVLGDTKFYRCFSSRQIESKVMTAGFIQQIDGGTIEECFSIGTIDVTFQASGFILSAESSYIKNCYSTCDINVINVDPDAETRTFASGIILVSMHGIEIENCYYGGKINGFVYTTSKVSGLGSIVATFAGSLHKSKLTNCHTLYNEGSFAEYIVMYYIDALAPLDLAYYNEIEEMRAIIELLNDGSDSAVWEIGDNGLPRLQWNKTVASIYPDHMSKEFADLLKEHGLKHIRLHDLRHSCASNMLASGIQMKEIQEWLGHSNFSTTADVYSQLDFSAKIKAAQTISSV